MAIVEKQGYPIGLYVASASPAEVKLVEKTLDSITLAEMPRCLIGDKAYDTDQLDKRLKEKYEIQLIAPNRRNRQKARMEDH